ncbi:ADP-heptose--LPS heptosyltransferase 2 [Pseudodesulfovibrio hydrargyri]|uniref:ADP-heptose--LPS heptosyltransferase 2 n=1 Tax=Pseudodesulfovibrio hydrargyri TaxID=2125990 RepID=A0A1J5N345_9BACT|nr:glycosyltransferase family 9 protein [Pseudodesulfovibrio hydrargyri]OIQ50043.1 ADP-heptose--LPS heptosyltransferase 2 [Pseudodesulfovibrio hydrargyri]
MAKDLVIKRTHGLGNVLLLLPVLEHLRDRGQSVRLLTRPEWTEALSALVDGIGIAPHDGRAANDCVDLDAMTLSIRPEEHRTLELARLLGVADDIGPGRYTVPDAWAKPYRHLEGCVVFAPEAGHPAREWPPEYVDELAQRLLGRPLVLTGSLSKPRVACDEDLRGKQGLPQMLGLLSVASAVVSLDSGTLHMATSLGVPAVAVFGGVDPRFRVRAGQRTIVLQADMACAPCDKKETCDGAYPCLKSLTPDHALAALDDLRLPGGQGREIRRIK